jgi:dTDP-4-dehydrorhamnose reductase
MTVLVCGASGILGKDLCKLLKIKNIEYIGTYNNNFTENSIKVDFFNLTELETVLNDNKVTVCVNCIVERQVDLCETNWVSIKKTNIDIANNLAKVCSKTNVYLIHISTDYVFDGLNSPYYPSSQPNPLQNYGMSKLISEYKVIANIKNYIIIRVPVLYTDNINNFQDTAVTLIGKKVLNRIDPTKEDNYSIRRPNYIPDFCKFIVDFIVNPKNGVYHFNNPHDKITKYEISNIISNYLNKNQLIIPINEEPNDGVERPKDTFLKDDKYDISIYNFTPLVEGIEKCFKKLWHPKLDLESDENTKNVFFMIDLDGTLINSDKIHYNSYRKCLLNAGVDLDYDTYYNILENEGIDKFIENKFGVESNNLIKKKKNKLLKDAEIVEFIENADKFIEWIDKYSVNHVVVTNTSSDSVEFFKSKLPLLNKLKNWIVREDYKIKKPNSECYELGKTKFYKNESNIIGIENSISGFSALKNLTSCIYIVTDKTFPSYNKLKNEDVYLINNFISIYK